MVNLIQRLKDGLTQAEAAVVICDNPLAGALEKSKRLGVETVLIERKKFKDKAAFEAEIIKQLEARRIDFIALAGFMRILSKEFVEHFWGRIINIHPSLLPVFPGAQAIKDAYDAKATETGVTTHFVIPAVDAGPTIMQKKVRIDADDTLETLEAKVHAVEYELYPETLKLVVEGKAVMPSQK